MYKRNIYIDRIRPFFGKPVIKVIIGMRRVGKSCLMRQLIDEVRETGISPDRIVYIDKEKYEFDAVRTYHDLMRYVSAHAPENGTRRCVFVDEVQEIESWEKAVVSLSSDPKTDIVIAGSNSRLLSSELATRISGRYVEFPVFSLSFAEFLLFRGSKAGAPRDEFMVYTRYGGMPGLHHLEFTDETIYQYLNSLHNTILLKDVIERHALRNSLQLEALVRFLYNGVGTIVSAKRISEYCKNQGTSIGIETVQNYIAALLPSFVLHRVRRFDVRGKRHLETLEKYYLGDIGLRHGILGFREGSRAGVLENIVFHELQIRGFSVSIGKIGDREIDFIVERNGKRSYIQVAYLLHPQETAEREFRVLKQINDNYPKYVISMDEAWGSDVEGIIRLNLVDFLLDATVPG
ncbi:MAG: ATP-binding protein [Chitinispirillaceae bacterium]|nr:ATP-binding protein [Chitinispirillaceae bacterium]